MYLFIKNHLPVCLSYLILGSEVLDPFITAAKKVSISVFNTPSATPVLLLKVTSLPFTATINCVGPTDPILSEGNDNVGFVPDNVAAVKDNGTVCGLSVLTFCSRILLSISFLGG